MFRFNFGLVIILLVFTSCKDQKDQITISEISTKELVPEIQVISVNRETEDFHFPVGKPDARGYYNAQPFGKNNHLGEDWNGKGGGNTDLGDDVFAIGHGVVISAENLEGGWGNVIRILHKQDGVLYESIYAHLDSMLVAEGQEVNKGLKIGTIGTADGAYFAHLHLEIRDEINMDIGGGYSQVTKGYLNPTVFIKTH